MVGQSYRATGGHVEFAHTATADHATLTANGGINWRRRRLIFFFDDSLGGRANIILSGNGTLDLSRINPGRDDRCDSRVTVGLCFSVLDADGE